MRPCTVAEEEEVSDDRHDKLRCARRNIKSLTIIHVHKRNTQMMITIHIHSVMKHLEI